MDFNYLHIENNCFSSHFLIPFSGSFFLFKSISGKIEQFHSCDTVGFLSVLSTTLFNFLQYQKWEKQLLWVKIVNLCLQKTSFYIGLLHEKRVFKMIWAELRMCLKFIPDIQSIPLLLKLLLHIRTVSACKIGSQKCNRLIVWVDIVRST